MAFMISVFSCLAKYTARPIYHARDVVPRRPNLLDLLNAEWCDCELAEQAELQAGFTMNFLQFMEVCAPVDSHSVAHSIGLGARRGFLSEHCLMLLPGRSRDDGWEPKGSSLTIWCQDIETGVCTTS